MHGQVYLGADRQYPAMSGMRYLNGRGGDLGDFVTGEPYANTSALDTAFPAASNSGKLGLVGTGASDALLHRSDGSNWMVRAPYQTAADFDAINAADYDDDTIVLAEDTGVLWRIVTSSVQSGDGSYQRGAIRAIVGESFIDWNRLDLFNGSGSELPSDQGWGAANEQGNGTVTASAGTVTHATTTSGDEADIATDTNAVSSTNWVGMDFSDMSVSISGSTNNNLARALLFWMDGGARSWMRIASESSSTWTVSTRAGSTANTGLAVATTRDLEMYYDVSTDRVLVYSNRAAVPALDTTLTTPVPSGAAEPYALIAVDQGSAGSVEFDYTRAFAMRSTS